MEINMELNKNLYQILKLVIESNGQASIKDIIKALNNSKRALYYNIDKLNQWLVDNDLNAAQFKNDRLIIKNQDLEILKDDYSSWDRTGYIFSKEERIAFTVLYVGLSHQNVTLDYLKTRFDVSKNTVMGELGQLKKEIRKQKIEIISIPKRGYVFKGDERQIRYLIMSKFFDGLASGVKSESLKILLSSVEYFSQTKIDPELLVHMEALVHDAEEFMKERLFSTSVYEVVLYILLIYVRNQKNAICGIDQRIYSTSDLAAAQYLIEAFQSYSIEIRSEEKNYLASVLLSSKVLDMGSMIDTKDVAYRLSKDIIDIFEAKMCVAFPEKQPMINKLLMHIKPMVYRAEFKIKVRSACVWEIKEKYYELYNVTRLILDQLGTKYGINIDDDEVCLISLYLGGYLRQRDMDDIEKRILIICGFGLGTSLMVKQQIEMVLGDAYEYVIKDVRQFTRNDLKSFDLVVSTVSRIEDQQIMYVSPLLTEYQKQKLIEWDMSVGVIKNKNLIPQEILNIVKKYAEVSDEQALVSNLKSYFMGNIEKEKGMDFSLKSILTKQHIFISDGQDSYEQAIRLACCLLMESNIIGNEYADSVLQIMETYGLYFEVCEGVILAHGKPSDKVSGVGISVTLFKEPVSFYKWDKKIEVIFMLATKDNFSHIQVIKDLLEFLKVEDNLRCLKACDFNCEEEVYQFLIKKIESDY